MPPKTTRSFVGEPDYEDAFHGSGYVHMGRRQHLSLYHNAVTNGEAEMRGSVLCPERRGEEWSYECNKAFWAGAIDAHRTFILETDLKNSDDAEALRNGCTGDELFWLRDNGYMFRPDPNSIDFSKTLAESPQIVGAIAESIVAGAHAVIRDYNRDSKRGTERHHKDVQRAKDLRKIDFESIRQPVLVARIALEEARLAEAETNSAEFEMG